MPSMPPIERWRIFKIVDATGMVCLSIGSWASYEPAFRKHAAWWKRHAKSKAYRDKVPTWRWPVFPVKIVIEDAD